RRIGRIRIALHNVLFSRAVASHQEVFVVAEMSIIAIGDPLLLNELELPGEIGVERHENYTAVDSIQLRCLLRRNRSIVRSVRPIRQATPRDAAAIDEAPFEAESIARMHTADVRSDGATCAGCVVTIFEIGASVGILSDGWIGAVRR